MANPTLNWRYVGSQTYVSAINNAHDALYTLGTAATYADGSARTPGTGSAWTWNREVSGVTVATYGVPPTNALGMAYLLGGTSGASAYTFLTPNTAATANLIAFSMQRGAGAYTTWTSATPFTTAGFSGFWQATRTFAATPYDSVSLWESQEACVIQWGYSATGGSSSAWLGALIDPLSSATNNCESDGRLYSMGGSGGSSLSSTSWAGISSDGSCWLTGLNTANTVKAGTFAPGTAVMYGGAGAQMTRLGGFAPSSSFICTNGDIAVAPMYFGYGNYYLGQLRNCGIVKSAISRLTWSNAGVTKGYVWSPSVTTAAQAVVMTY